ncbi:kinase-like protein [Thelephora ganbajun]|uniref:Kinase-like protein n=1 Tax=Thelephora ganbajun TaxID=370292 RepID=A0ACB6ZNT4_THEGA|nr:kinase-like protein [Thelephora ganbajun]
MPPLLLVATSCLRLQKRDLVTRIEQQIAHLETRSPESQSNSELPSAPKHTLARILVDPGSVVTATDIFPTSTPRLPHLHPSRTTGSLSLEDAVKRIDEIAEELANGTSKSKWETTIELRRLCGHHFTFPASYKLVGVVKEGDCAQHNSRVAEIWKGRYDGEVVALKVLRVPRDEPGIRGAESWFCKEVVLMKQVNHDNIVPRYGVSTTVSRFCLVSPWYENGNVMDYIRREPNINRLGLATVNGLLFLHKNQLVHGSLRPSHILIDDNGTARLAISGRKSTIAVPGVVDGDGDGDGYGYRDISNRYSALEIMWPRGYGMVDIVMTKESDVYGMASVIYEAGFHHPPHYNDNSYEIPAKVRAGETPERPSDRIDDPTWELLEECWKLDPMERPPTDTVYNTLLKLSSHPRVIHTPHPGGRWVTGELPQKLEFQFQNIKISSNKSNRQQFSVRLKYGYRKHATALTKPVDDSGEYTWFAFRPSRCHYLH